MNSEQKPRRAGVLVPLFSIRTTDRDGGGWGVGEIPDLVVFADWAARAGFSVLQLLPVNEVTGGETSPYSAGTAFALDPVYLALDRCEDFLALGGRDALLDEDRRVLDALVAAPRVDWAGVRALKGRWLRRAYERFRDEEWRANSARAEALRRFGEEERDWLDEYALFAALHDRHQSWWRDWPAPLRDRDPAALAQAARELEDEILEKRWQQWQLDAQWKRARAEALARGVELMGDLPFMVSGDSADVWARQDQFRLDRRVGTPPDAFSAEGQDWGLPVYDWARMEETDFAWIRSRAARCAELYALYRVDHVIGLYRTYYRDAADKTVNGFTPETEEEQVRLGERLLQIMERSAEIVAEDLGMVPPFLRPSLTALGIPGYRVMRWEKEEDGTFRDPADWPRLSVATNGTHDIETDAEWWDALPAEEKKALLAIPALAKLAPDQAFDDQVRDTLLEVLYQAPSVLVIVPLQDTLGTRERVNVPGTVGPENWTYRMATSVEALARTDAAERLRTLAERSDRRLPGGG
jgi:4-alpha-glucanotransferase